MTAAPDRKRLMDALSDLDCALVMVRALNEAACVISDHDEFASEKMGAISGVSNAMARYLREAYDAYERARAAIPT